MSRCNWILPAFFVSCFVWTVYMDTLLRDKAIERSPYFATTLAMGMEVSDGK